MPFQIRFNIISSNKSNVDFLITAKGSLYDFRNDMILGNWRVVEAPFSKVYIEPSTEATRHVITQHYFFLSHILESRKEIWHYIKSLILLINILHLLFIFQLQNTNHLSENQFIPNRIMFDYLNIIKKLCSWRCFFRQSIILALHSEENLGSTRKN